MRPVNVPEAYGLIDWLGRPPWTSEVNAGYFRDDWADSVWVLHGMYEWGGLPDITRQELREQAVADGADDPLVTCTATHAEGVLDALRTAGGVVLFGADGFVDTGIPLGFVRTPGPPWQRLTWRALAERLGYELGSGTALAPCLRWFPASFPVNIQPPPEGSLDESTMHVLLDLITEHSPVDEFRDCVAFYGSAATGEFEIAVFTGGLREVPELVKGRHKMRGTPSNLWPADRSWFVYTDADLMATRVSGPAELIEAVEAHPALETVRWNRSIDTYLEVHSVDVAPVLGGDIGAPQITMPYPPGWVDAHHTPGVAYSMIVYAEAAAPPWPDITVSVFQLLPRRAKSVDPQEIVKLAAGQMRRQKGYAAVADGAFVVLDGFTAYREAGTVGHGSRAAFVAQLMLVVPDGDNAYLVRFVAGGLHHHRDIVSAAADLVFTQTTVRQCGL